MNVITSASVKRRRPAAALRFPLATGARGGVTIKFPVTASGVEAHSKEDCNDTDARRARSKRPRVLPQLTSWLVQRGQGGRLRTMWSSW